LADGNFGVVLRDEKIQEALLALVKES